MEEVGDGGPGREKPGARGKDEEGGTNGEGSKDV